MSTALEDKEAIRELLANYCFNIDRPNPKALIALFSEDAAWEMNGIGRFTGPALHEFLTKTAEGGSKMRHVTSNEVISVNGNNATARSYIVLFVPGEKPTPDFSAFYEDKLVKTGGRWLFKERVVATA